ncbi:serine/threonine-protein kinase [Streptomyces leeuwenhoekii]|uniref:non-specific serine/threonine protein kinase n=2 Tax=Streptomyces leeuwenhoekii TaxID=1437453 RepID=A0A0F7VRE9_STRLW|nr:serine/threonine-protein kinase [Streptomyces leeuwenhoekii]KMS68060.1 serine/threonine protein kinase [Streptomyces leeuwenhoekii]CQR62355.1 Probable serine/threonine-protein kinase pknB [Streptomyces leeuwenhoekii]
MVTEGETGRVIAGRYRLQDRLGRGGMGVVWRATDQLLGRQVAVKELPSDDSLSAAQARRRRDRTLREARALAQLHHPNVIVVHDVVEHDERPYIVMELVDGGSLADRVAGRGPVDAREAARIGVALLGALRTAHAAGVLHRDVKPSNVLVAEDGRVVLTDFGVAHVAGTSTLTESGTLVGSPEYTAPERMSGVRTGPESDLWSLGALLCAVLSGESPFHRDSLGGILHAVVSEEIRPPAQAGPLLPVIRGLLERDPDRRLDAAQAEEMLRAYLETGRTFPPAGTADPRRTTRTVLLAALLAAATAGAGISAAALITDRDGGGDGTPASPAPRTTPPPGAPSPPASPPPSPSSEPSANRSAGRSSAPEPGAPVSTVTVTVSQGAGPS